MSGQTTYTSSFEAFEPQARADGFDEVLIREWKPDTVPKTSTNISKRLKRHIGMIVKYAHRTVLQ